MSGHISPELQALANELPDKYVESDSSAKKPPKSGVFTRSYVSRNLPDDISLVDKINDVFKQFYKRDATQNEVEVLLPSFRAKYKSKDGASKSTIKETYKNGQLVSTDYFTADNLDPKLWLEGEIKSKLLADAESIVQVGIPEGPIGQNFVQVKNFAAKNGIMMSDDAASDYATQIVTGKLSEDTVFNAIRESAASAFPPHAEKMKPVNDVKTEDDSQKRATHNICVIP